jgi:CubicO group peptidase (beta-lactamase class C family)
VRRRGGLVAKRWNRTETWVTMIVLGIGGALAALGGLWIYISATATPLHPNAHGVPSVTQTDPVPQWAGVVEKARQIVRTGLSEQNLPGVSVAVGVAGDLVWAEGFGFADIEQRSPVTPATRFRIGTASIALTSAAAGLLIERKSLDLNAEIQRYVPAFPTKEHTVTLRQVMGHLAGIRSDGGDEGPLFGQHCDRAVDALPAFADAALRFEPGTQYQYSRFGWILVSAAIEAASGDHLLRFMQTEIFTPLSMHDTLADSTTESIENLATPYFPRFAADPRYGPDPMRPIDLSCYSGSSVFLSTPSDLVRFGIAVSTGTLLQPATVELLQTSQRLSSGEETGYGLGWDLEKITVAAEPVRVVGHDGDVLGGIVSSLMTVPERRIVVAVIANTSYADTFSLAEKIAAAFAGHH